jgi:hypothetical protein
MGSFHLKTPEARGLDDSQNHFGIAQHIFSILMRQQAAELFEKLKFALPRFFCSTGDPQMLAVQYMDSLKKVVQQLLCNVCPVLWKRPRITIASISSQKTRIIQSVPSTDYCT